MNNPDLFLLEAARSQPLNDFLGTPVQYRMKVRTYSNCPPEISVQRVDLTRDAEAYLRAWDKGFSNCGKRSGGARTAKPVEERSEEDIQRSCFRSRAVCVHWSLSWPRIISPPSRRGRMALAPISRQMIGKPFGLISSAWCVKPASVSSTWACLSVTVKSPAFASARCVARTSVLWPAATLLAHSHLWPPGGQGA